MKNKNNHKIDISVVVPAYNEEHLLSLCLDALKNQDFTGNYEIIVVNNNSTDKTVEVAKKYNVIVQSEKRKGVAFARQTGFEKSQGKIIATTDADTIVPKNWLTKIYNAFQSKKNIVVVSGPIDFFGQTKRRLTILNIFAPITRLIGFVLLRKPYFYGANFAIRKNIFEKIGGFDTRLAVGEDMDLGIHAQEFGQIQYIGNLRVRTSARKWEHQSGSARGVKYLFKAYLFNFWSFVLYKKPRINELKDIRMVGKHNLPSERKLKIVRVAGYGLMVLFFVFLVALWGFFYPKSQVFGKTYWGKKTHEKIIALTFDDGPNEPYTSQILDILNKYNIKATFFTIGENVKYYPETSRKIVDEGHVIANHSYSHQSDLSIEDKKTVAKEIDWNQNAILETTGKLPHLFRPPHGFKSPWLLDELKKDNLLTIEWSDMTSDWQQPPAKKIIEAILKKARPGGIIVLHDGNATSHHTSRAQEVNALPTIIEELQKKGYKFVTVSELFYVPAYNN